MVFLLYWFYTIAENFCALLAIRGTWWSELFYKSACCVMVRGTFTQLGGVVVIVKQTLAVKIKYLEEAVELAQDAAQEALAEASCLSFDVYIQVDDPGCVVLWQSWQSEDEAQGYLASAAVADFMLALDGILAAPVASVCYSVDGLGALAFEVVPEEQEAVHLGDEVTVH